MPDASSGHSKPPRQPKKGKGSWHMSLLHLRMHERAQGETPSTFRRSHSAHGRVPPNSASLSQSALPKRGVQSVWSPGHACQTQLYSAWSWACKDATPKGRSVAQEKTQLLLHPVTSARKTCSPALTSVFSLFIWENFGAGTGCCEDLLAWRGGSSLPALLQDLHHFPAHLLPAQKSIWQLPEPQGDPRTQHHWERRDPVRKPQLGVI